MISPFSLKIIDMNLRNDYSKAIMVKAYESQFHVLVAFLLAFISSATYSLVVYSKGDVADSSVQYRLYADLLRFIVYLIIIVAGYRYDILRSYGACFMIVFFNLVLTELYTLLGDPQKVFPRLLSYSLLVVYCPSLIPMGYIPSLFVPLAYFLYPVFRYISNIDIETTLIMLNAMVIAIYFLYVLKKYHTSQFVEMQLNEKINAHWKQVIEDSPYPCIICSYGEPKVEYANGYARRTFFFQSTTESKSDIESMYSTSWKVYKSDNAPTEEGISFLHWVRTDDFSVRCLRNDEAPDQTYEFKGSKIIYENKEAKLYTFQNTTKSNKCNFFQRESRCKSGLLLANMLSRFSGVVESINDITEAMSSHVTNNGQKLLKDMKSTSQYIEHMLQETSDYIKIQHGRLALSKEAVNTHEIIEKSFKMVESFAKSKGLALAVQHRTELPRFIEADEARLKEVLVELLGCAIKLTHYGTVTLVTKTTKKENIEKIKWSITGTGLDLSETVITSTLDAPSIVHRDKRKPRISLFISQPLIEAFGGTFKVRAKSGKLSYVGFTMPITVRKQEDFVKDSSIAIEIQEENKCECPKILIVDSNPMDQFVVGSLLDKLKVQYKIAQDATNTLNLIEERLTQDCCQHYSLVLIDSGIEGGYAEVAEQVYYLCERDSKCAIVLLDDVVEKDNSSRELLFAQHCIEPITKKISKKAAVIRKLARPAEETRIAEGLYD